MEPQRVHITGASGSGTTTLACALADAWAIPHADVDDYFWEPTDPPFTTKREPDARLELMDAVFLPRPAWVLSGSVMGWGDSLTSRVDAVVFVTLEPSTRLARLEERERRRYGSRIDPGGDREPALREFLTWAAGYDDPDFAGRSRAVHEWWLTTLSCPVLRLTSTAPVDELVSEVLDWTPPPQS